MIHPTYFLTFKKNVLYVVSLFLCCLTVIFSRYGEGTRQGRVLEGPACLEQANAH